MNIRRERMVHMAHTSADRLVLADWRPRSRTVAPRSHVPRPAVPCVDVHNHLGTWLSGTGGWLVEDVPALLAVLDAHDVATVVNLDGRWGAELDANLDRYDRAHRGRFVTFCQLDWTALTADDPTTALCAQLDDAARRGARGLKVWKDLGLSHRDATGALVLPDDPRLTAVFARAGELGLPVLIHTADPVAFFDPLDRHNERLDELGAHPDWWFGADTTPTFDRLMAALETLVASTPGTTYIGAHVGCHAEDLARVGAMFDRHPNFHADIGGRIGELGRTPRGFRTLVTAHADRVLFGTDAYPPTGEAYELAYRFLETADEAFDYAPGEEVPPQGRWQISAAELPAEVLPALYAGNARRLLRLD
jgi:predicted TIM-barrel fold metal-dependent hydrolase